MGCLRTEELDLAGFLADPTAPGFRSFREHYPGCRDCSAEIRVWTELHLELQGAGTHPSPDDLLLLQDAPESLSADELDRLTVHLASCSSCLEEVRALEAFAAPTVAVAMSADARSSPMVSEAHRGPELPFDEPEPSGRENVSWTRRLGRTLWNPAFAYAALLAVTLPLVYLRRDVVVEPVRQSMAPPSVPKAERAAPATETLRTASLASEAPREQAPEHPPAAPSRLEGEVALQRMAPAAPVADRATRGARAPATELRDVVRSRRPAPSYAEAVHAEEAVVEQTARPLVGRRDGDVLHLNLAVSSRLASSRAVEVRVVAPGGRELVQPVNAAPAAETIALDLPASWLGAGPLRVEVRDQRGRLEHFSVILPPAD